MIIVALVTLAFVAVVYVFLLRPWVRRQPWAATFFAWADPVEARLWARSRAILVARLYWLGGLVLGAHESLAAFIGGQDWTPVLVRLFRQIPDDLRPLVITMSIAGFATITGALIEWLRRVTVKPVESGKE